MSETIYHQNKQHFLNSLLFQNRSLLRIENGQFNHFNGYQVLCAQTSKYFPENMHKEP